MKRLAGFLTVLGAVLLGFAPPASADYPPGATAALTATPASGGPGYTVTATVSNCFPGESLTFTLGTSTATATCSATTFQATVTLTAPQAPGPYNVTVPLQPQGQTPQANRPRVLSAPITVVAAPTTTVPATLPETGGSDGSGGVGGGTGTGGQPGLPGGGLPATGSSGLSTTGTIAITLLAAGAGMFAVARLRRRQPNPAA